MSRLSKIFTVVGMVVLVAGVALISVPVAVGLAGALLMMAGLSDLGE